MGKTQRQKKICKTCIKEEMVASLSFTKLIIELSSLRKKTGSNAPV